MLLAALTRWVLRHKTLVVLVWLGLTAAGAASAPGAIRAMSADFGSLPGRPGYETNRQIRRLYGNGDDANPLVLVVQLPEGTTVDSPSVRSQLATAVAHAAHTLGGGRAASYADGGDRGFVSADRRTTLPCSTRPQDHSSRPTPACCPGWSRPWTASGSGGRRCG